LLLDAIQGDAGLFIRGDEIERAWELMDPIIEATSRQTPEEYPIGSQGPAASDSLIGRDGRKWQAIAG
jgi:glucose-6-phosphate 1-dehydrogenase